MSPRNVIVSRGERELHNLLQVIWAPYHVLPKVALRDVFDIDNRVKWSQDELNYMFHGAHFDFVIAVSEELWPVLAIEFDGSFHNSFMRDDARGWRRFSSRRLGAQQ